MNPHARDCSDVVDDQHVARIGHGYEESPILEGEGNHRIAARHRLRDQPRCGWVHRHIGEVDVLNAHVAGQHADELGLVDHLLFDEDSGQSFAGLRL